MRLFAFNNYKSIIIYKGEEVCVKFSATYLSYYMRFYNRDNAEQHFRIHLSSKDYNCLKRKCDENN